MKFIILCSLFIFSSTTTLAALNLKPGLWEVKTNTPGGKDPMEQIKKSLSQMSPEQRKQVEKMMAQQGVSMGKGNAMKVCLTDELLKNEQALMNRATKHSNCTSKITKQTASLVAVDLTCEDGSKGTGEWNITGREKYKGTFKMTGTDGAQSQMNHEGRFVSANCGNVKPFKP